jgi:flagellar basal-body rod protein FlgB
MWSSFLQSTPLSAIEQTLSFTERRHGLLAGNVANADTPGYQTRDLSLVNFQSALKESLAGRQQPDGIASTASPSPRGQSAKSEAQAQVRDAMTQILYHDGSDVSLERQVTEIAKNQSMHATAITVLRNQYQLLQMAIAGTVNV